MLRNTWSGLLLTALLLISGSVQTAVAQDVKIGYTEPNLIISQMAEYRSIMEQLQALAEGGQAEYQELVQTYQTDVTDYQKKQALLSQEVRQSREEQLIAKQTEIQQFLQSKEQELAEKELELLGPLLEKVQNAINEVAQEQGLNLILSAQPGTAPVILYADESMDITEAVMNKLGIEPPPQDGTSP